MDVHLPPIQVLEQWFPLVAADHSHLLPAARWLVLGSSFFELLHQTPEPDHDQLTELLRLLSRRNPRSADLLEALAATSAAGRQALLELDVDKLLEADGWTHPNQVLPYPRPDHGKLLSICTRRLERTPGRGEAATRLEAVTFKVQRAARFSEEARQTRERRRARRPRDPRPLD